MAFFLEPSVWLGLMALVVLEIILGIDNLVFIAILANKLSPYQRNKARMIGLSLALILRLALLSLISWLVTLTKPVFSIAMLTFSGRDLIMLSGGLFLLFKATTELHERLENKPEDHAQHKNYAGFWRVVAQIVVLDVVFSLDAVITAVGMISQLPVMMVAVVIAMLVMLLASEPLTKFVNQHPTVVVLCLSFLLMVGLSLMAEGVGFHIPKGYLYAAMGFSVLIEVFNQLAQRNFIRHQARRPLRVRTAEAILRLMGGEQPATEPAAEHKDAPLSMTENVFADEERYMINGVLTLASRSLRSIMTPRSEISWVDVTLTAKEIRQQLLASPHSLFPACRGELDELLGVVSAKSLLVALEEKHDLSVLAAASAAIVVPETLDPIKLLTVLRRARGSLVIVSNEFGVVQGLLTPLDVLEAIAGEFPDADEIPEIREDGEGYLVKGTTDLHTLRQYLDLPTFACDDNNIVTVAGLIIAIHGHIPKAGDVISVSPLDIRVLETDNYRIELVRIVKTSLLIHTDE